MNHEPTDPVRLTAWLHGRVQGVGMRWWVRARALELGLAGWARNTEDGRVEIVAEGAREATARLLEELRSESHNDSHNDSVARPGQIDSVVERWAPATGELSGFVER